MVQNVHHLSAINLLNPFQSAYPPEYSTETDLLKMVNGLLPSFLPSGIVTSVSHILTTNLAAVVCVRVSVQNLTNFCPHALISTPNVPKFLIQVQLY